MNKPVDYLDEEHQKAAIVLARNDLIDFSILTNPRYDPHWLHEEIGMKLMAVERGEIRRLMIAMPPRYGKSQLASINFPAWYLGRNPDKEIIIASYSADLAQDFGYKTRDLVSSGEYGQIFETRLKEDSKSKAKWLTDKNGSYTAVGIGGSLTGRGANCLLLDDPLKNREDVESQTIREKTYSWYTSTAYTRLEKDAAVVLIMTRWHFDDLAGRILREDPKGWEVINFPAIATQQEAHRAVGDPLWPQKYPLETLLETKRTIGTYDWNSLYQQTPIASEAQEFKKEYIRYFEEQEIAGKTLKYYITVDLAIDQKESADNTAIVVVGREDGNPNWYIVDTIVGKQTPVETIDALFSLYQQYRPVRIGIETVAYQKSMIYFLREEMKRRQVYLPLEEVKSTGAKEVRIRGLVPLYQTSVIFQRKNQIQLEEELLTFPKGIHDDTIDALAFQLQIQGLTPNRPRSNDERLKVLMARQQQKQYLRAV